MSQNIKGSSELTDLEKCFFGKPTHGNPMIVKRDDLSSIDKVKDLKIV